MATWSGCATTPCWCAAEDGPKRWHGVMSDITEQKEAEAELERRAAQQAAVARLGEHALEGASTSDLMQEAVSAAAQLLNVEIAAVLELMPEEEFVFRAVHGTVRGDQHGDDGARRASCPRRGTRSSPAPR